VTAAVSQWGVTPAGFVLKPVTQIRTEYTGELLTLIDPTTDVSDDQPLGQALGIGSKKLGEVWQLGQAAYAATDRGNAEGDQLDNVNGMTGTIRLSEAPSTVQCTATFSAAGTNVPGSLVCYPAPPAANTSQFQNQNAIVVPALGCDGLTAVSAANTWPQAAGVAGNLSWSAAGGGTATLTTGGTGSIIPLSANGGTVTISGAAYAGSNGTFQGVVRGTGISISWPMPAGPPVTDVNNGAIVWLANPLFGATLFPFASVAAGPLSGQALVAANAAAAVTSGVGVGQLNQLVPVAGWVNVADAGVVNIGTLVELDPPYRVRGYQDLSAPGNDTLDATAAAILLALQNAPQPPAQFGVKMYENTTLVTDANGVPGRSYMAVVYDGTIPNVVQNDPLIGQAIWNNVPGGGEPSYGSAAGIYARTVSVFDSQGVLRTVQFARPSAIPIYLLFTVSVASLATMNPGQQAALIAAITVSLVSASQGQPFPLYGTTFTPGPGALTTFAPGVDVIANALRSIVQGQAGVVDVPAATFFLGEAPGPGATGNIGMGSVFNLPTLSSANVAISLQQFV
jgi:hypothetical protein